MYLKAQRDTEYEMWKCGNCGRTFEEPEIELTSWEEYNGVSSLFSNSNPLELEVCPYCGDDGYLEEIDEEDLEEE